MADESGKVTWEDRLRDAASHAETDVKRLITYINDEVMPDVRRNGSNALRTASEELQKLADKMDEARKTPPAPPKS